jgi:hypothetical protein
MGVFADNTKRAIALLNGKVDRSFGMARSIALFCIEKSIALFAWKGRSLFVSWKGRSLFWYGKVDRSFGMARSIALFGMAPVARSFGMERSIALSSSFSTNGDLSPQLNVGAIALLVTSVFAGKCDRPTYIPDAKPAIALLE